VPQNALSETDLADLLACRQGGSATAGHFFVATLFLFSF
jgi:hypothetical protein